MNMNHLPRTLSIVWLTLTWALAAALAGPAAPMTAPAPQDADLAELAHRTHPMDREQTFEFSQEPSLAKTGADTYRIHFAVKSKCDVAVAVEDQNGRIVRYLGYGVLGPNAPAPFAKDALEQTITWDGKDQFGKYVPVPQDCRVRVSLGLKPTFDRVIAWHPKNPSAGLGIAAISADAGGVYVLETGSYNQLRKYDHDGNYVRTLYPYDPTLLEKIDIPRRDLPDAKVSPTGAKPPILCSFGGTLPFSAVAKPFSMAAANGRIAFYTKGGLNDVRRVLRLTTEGTTPLEGIEGAPFGASQLVWAGEGGRGAKVPITFASPAHLAISPDGKWLYVSGLAMAQERYMRDMREERAPYCWNAVFRVAWESKDLVIGQQAFAGEVSKGNDLGAGKDNAHFNEPQGMACDSAGRLYVCDYNNDRLQVFAPDGKLVKTIPIPEPEEIGVNQKTGEIYVLCYKYVRESAPTLRIVKLGPLDDPKVRAELTITGPTGDMRVHSYTPVMALDSWSTPPRVWLTARRGEIRVLDDAGSAFKPACSFRELVEKDGYTFAVMTGNKMGYIVADPIRGDIYRGSGKCAPWVRMDPENGKKWDELGMPAWRLGSFEEVHVGMNGLLYARNLNYIARFDPDKIKKSDNVFSLSAEVPFDYGEATGPADCRYRGVLNVGWAMGGANGFDNGVAVGPNGEVYAMVEIYTSIEDFRGSNGMGGDTLLNIFKAQAPEDRHRPRMFAGRKYSSGYLVWRWSGRGEITGVDLVPGLELRSSGIRADQWGNMYIGIGYHQNVGGNIHIGSALGKFPPEGGKFVNTEGTPKLGLADTPNRDPDYFDYSKSNRIWAYNMFWSYPGLDQMMYCDPNGGLYTCHCNVVKFDTDPYGRSFAPKAYAFVVGVTDTNGNRICEIGRYGNPDSPAMKPGDADIGLADCSFLTTVPDRWLYLNDDANLRIIRLKLGYAAEKWLPVP